VNIVVGITCCGCPRIMSGRRISVQLSIKGPMMVLKSDVPSLENNVVTLMSVGLHGDQGMRQ